MDSVPVPNSEGDGVETRTEGKGDVKGAHRGVSPRGWGDRRKTETPVGSGSMDGVPNRTRERDGPCGKGYIRVSVRK